MSKQSQLRSAGSAGVVKVKRFLCLKGRWTPDWWHTMGPIHKLPPICRALRGPICRSIVPGADSSCAGHAIIWRCSDHRLSSDQHQSDRTRSHPQHTALPQPARVITLRQPHYNYFCYLIQNKPQLNIYTVSYINNILDIHICICIFI